MKRAHGTRSSWTATLAAFAAGAVLALAACGGSGTTTSASPSAAVSVPDFSEPSASPVPAATVAGTIAFAMVVDSGGYDADIYVVDSDGTQLTTIVGGTDWQQHPSWSPDGKRIVYDAGSSDTIGNDIWVVRADGSGKAKLTSGYHPHWSPDGRRIIFNRYFSDNRGEDVFVMNADGSGVKRAVAMTPDDTNPSWTPDGRILFTGSGGDVYVVDLDGRGRERLTSDLDVQDSAASPNGKMLAYHDANGDRVVVVPLRGAGAPVTLLEPLSDFIDNPEAAVGWTPDGRALAIASNDGGGPGGSILYIVNADGSGLTAVPGIDKALDPAWRPE